MATFRKVSRHVPSSQRSTSITDVVEGDEIDVEAILGRPAQGVKIVPFNESDSISVRLNNRIKIPTFYPKSGYAEEGQKKPDTVVVVSAGEHFPVYEMTGAEAYYTETGLRVSFIQIVDITFAGTSGAVEIEVW